MGKGSVKLFRKVSSAAFSTGSFSQSSVEIFCRGQSELTNTSHRRLWNNIIFDPVLSPLHAHNHARTRCICEEYRLSRSHEYCVPRHFLNRTMVSSPSRPDPPSGASSSKQAAAATFPYATSPDIVRSNQKDVFLTNQLQTQLSDILRNTFGSRFSHKYTSEIESGASLFYFGLTTLLGNRTLGEEYTDIYSIESSAGSPQRLPSIRRRTAYIISSILLPYAAGKILPSLRSRMRARLEKQVAKENETPSALASIRAYLLTHIASITSPASVSAFTLTLFYFSGDYYHLSKRLLDLRYVFTRHLSKFELEQRSGYEVLGVLLVVQMIVQVVVHAQSVLKVQSFLDSGHELSKHHLDVDTNQARELGIPTYGVASGSMDSRSRAALATHTPFIKSDEARYDLGDPSLLSWVQPSQQRKCTLCLEPMKDPSANTCGHVFCWTCIQDWIREKPECPLCRQSILSQHVLPLRG